MKQSEKQIFEMSNKEVIVQYTKLIMGFIFGSIVIALLVMIMLKLDCLCK